MKILNITEDAITFDNGNTITYDHEQDCCEWNYADFKQIDEKPIYNKEFDENLIFEAVEEAGFRFGSNPLDMVFVPCYSCQNGYYSSDIQILYNGIPMLCFEAEGQFA